MRNLNNWEKRIEEVSNGVWKVSLKHYSGMKVEKTGDNLEEIEKEIELSAIEKEKQLKEIS